ncbi:MAG: hypothetical protein ACT4P4_01180 [Betaproteobacteria bacterium]
MRGAPLSASKLGFAKRDRGAAPIVAQDIGLGQPLPAHKVGEAKHAELRMGNEAILVHDIRPDGDGAYSGEIYSFEPHHGVVFDTLRLGDRIVFRDEHVFSCGK